MKLELDKNYILKNGDSVVVIEERNDGTVVCCNDYGESGIYKKSGELFIPKVIRDVIGDRLDIDHEEK